MNLPVPGRGREGALDIGGALALITGVVPLLVPLSLMGGAGAQGSAGGVPTVLPVALALLGLLGALTFFAIERRARDPIVDLRLFRNRVMGVATAAQFVQGNFFLFSMVFLPLFLVNVIGGEDSGDDTGRCRDGPQPG